jgi:hypothetical protein
MTPIATAVIFFVGIGLAASRVAPRRCGDEAEPR